MLQTTSMRCSDLIEDGVCFRSESVNSPYEEQSRLDDLLKRIAVTVHDRLHFRPELNLVEAGTLPRHEMKGRRV